MQNGVHQSSARWATMPSVCFHPPSKNRCSTNSDDEINMEYKTKQDYNAINRRSMGARSDGSTRKQRPREPSQLQCSTAADEDFIHSGTLTAQTDNLTIDSRGFDQILQGDRQNNGKIFLERESRRQNTSRCPHGNHQRIDNGHSQKKLRREIAASRIYLIQSIYMSPLEAAAGAVVIR